MQTPQPHLTQKLMYMPLKKTSMPGTAMRTGQPGTYRQHISFHNLEPTRLCPRVNGMTAACIVDNLFTCNALFR